MRKKRIVVIGGGHAGVEAAAAAARLDAEVLLITLRQSDIGAMSCNPAFGGIGKGHIVREIDALDGVMAATADKAAIQYRLLNRSKGPAVRGPRVQADRRHYNLAVVSALDDYHNIRLLYDEVIGLKMAGNKITGVTTAANQVISCDSAIVCGGTFLNGCLHIGNETTPGGRRGASSSNRFGEFLGDLNLKRSRLKTGTPPRIASDSIDWQVLEMQFGDEDPFFMSAVTDRIHLPQLGCAITRTNPKFHDLIRSNIKLSPMYSGKLTDCGPRGCPSIEDKVMRFADRESHQIFLEPEGLDSEITYPNGISTGLPTWLQKKMVRELPGCENARILTPGYAVSYDFFDPRGLRSSLEVRGISGLFLAGQINGTTGYEEAGGQGLAAGINAALEGEDFVFSRGDSYIGVMIDDLTSRGVSEPYRMLTARAEYRLKLRCDNAEQRLTGRGIEFGLLRPERQQFFNNRQQLRHQVGSSNGSLNRFSQHQVLAKAKQNGDLQELPNWLAQEIVADNLYSGYIDRIERDIARFEREKTLSIPQDFDYSAVNGLSNEAGDRLQQSKPDSIATAARIEGVTPEAVILIMQRLRRGA